MNIILGGGLSGLSAAAWLTRAGQPATVLEKDGQVGGLARTVSHGDFRFDLGGHRFLTNNEQLRSFVAELLGDDLLQVPRKSQIYLGGKYVDYPLSPANAIFGTGFSQTGAILLNYAREKCRSIIRPRPVTSLEDWVVSRFGRTIFNLYFKNYSEKVWGIDCRQISRDWVARRIDGLSLRQFIVHSLFKFTASGSKTLTDSFSYPRRGIGQLSDRLQDLVAGRNEVRTGAVVEKIFHGGGRISGIQFQDGITSQLCEGSSYLSSIPITRLLEKMSPSPPGPVCRAGAGIRFRSLVIVALFLNRPAMTDLTWMYFPGRDIPFGRIHEPKNWSSALAPAGQSHVVAEYFCNRDDHIWQSPDDDLTELTAHHLRELGFFGRDELLGSRVLRIPYAYPVFDLQYRKHLQIITDYLGRFANLHLVGRNGMFSYLNMDQAMESGILAAERVMQGCRQDDAAPANEASFSCRLLQPNYS
ncbi:MAG: FAD-dependent oxidoreductase [Desulfobulbaceae bacterium]